MRVSRSFATLKRCFLTILAGILVLLVPGAQAQVTAIAISTNNTPNDRRALEALSKEAFRRMGITFSLVNLPSERSLQAANLGEVDGEGLRVAGLGDAFPNLVQVPERYIRISMVAFAKDKSISLDNGWTSLRPYSVAHINGWKLYEANAGTARVVNKVEKPEQLFRMVESARADLALYTLADGIALVREMGLKDIVPLSPPLQEVDMYLYLHKKHAALVPKLAQHLKDMKSDGSYARILSSIQ